MTKQNTGDWNTGYYNTGYCNTGDYNIGNWNTGYCNAGSRNIGNWNTGYCNAGSRNTGDHNTGSRNAGSHNTGDHNTGNWNTGDYNTGYCNSINPDECYIFNKKGSRIAWIQAIKPKWMSALLTQWVYEEDMSDKEKASYPSYITTGGYLKCYSSLKAAYIDAWEKSTEEDRELTRQLPNFDEDVFEEVFGFNPWKKKKHTIVIDGKEIKLSEESYNALKESLNDKN